MEDCELFVGEDTQQCLEQCTQWKRESEEGKSLTCESNVADLSKPWWDPQNSKTCWHNLNKWVEYKVLGLSDSPVSLALGCSRLTRPHFIWAIKTNPDALSWAICGKKEASTQVNYKNFSTLGVINLVQTATIRVSWHEFMRSLHSPGDKNVARL